MLFEVPKALVWPQFKNEEQWKQRNKGYVRMFSRDFRIFSKYFIQSVMKKSGPEVAGMHHRVKEGLKK